MPPGYKHRIDQLITASAGYSDGITAIEKTKTLILITKHWVHHINKHIQLYS